MLDGIDKTMYVKPLSRQVPPLPKQRHTARGHGGRFAKVNPGHPVKPMAGADKAEAKYPAKRQMPVKPMPHHRSGK